MLIECNTSFCRVKPLTDDFRHEGGCENVLVTDLVIFDIELDSVSGFCDAANCWELKGDFVGNLCVVAGDFELNEDSYKYQDYDFYKQYYEFHSVKSVVVEESKVNDFFNGFLMVVFLGIVILIGLILRKK